MPSLLEAFKKVGFVPKEEPAPISIVPMPECPEPELASVEKRPKWKKPPPIPVEFGVPATDRLLLVFRMKHGRVPTSFQRHPPEKRTAPADGKKELDRIDVRINVDELLSEYALNNAYAVERTNDEEEQYDYLYLWFEPAGEHVGLNYFAESYGEFLGEVFASTWNFLRSYDNGSFRSLNFVGEHGPRHPPRTNLNFDDFSDGEEG